MPEIRSGSLAFRVEADGSSASIRAEDWPGFALGPLTCGLKVNGRDLKPSGAAATRLDYDAIEIAAAFDDPPLLLRFLVADAGDGTLSINAALTNSGHDDIVLNHVTSLGLDTCREQKASFGADPQRVRIYEQSAYAGRVRPLCKPARTEGAGSEPGATELQESTSQLCWLAYDVANRHALLAGFKTCARWIGTVRLSANASGEIAQWEAGFDGGDLRVLPGETVALEDMIIIAGEDPLVLLDRYGDEVAETNNAVVPEQIPVSWCSWYPFRLGVTEEKMLANARIGAERLKPLGLSIIEADLGWERGQLPGAFQENELFPSGLRSLADRLGELGLRLGVWKAPYTISEFDLLFKEHPDWLMPGEDGKPAPQGEWFWQPHGQTYALDLTHPGAQYHLRQQVTSLAARGVFYFKTDFIGMVSSGALRRRHNDRIVAGGGWEAARIGSEIMHQALRSNDPGALILCCGGPEMPGRGQFALLYSCMDTGNTGYVGWRHLGETYTSVAAHLFKHRRWGIIQPSCLVVGLPGTLEEARVRATATFLSGGQVDISDNLTTLPEDRWQVLCATLPPQGRAARPVDLFEPVSITSMSYEAMARGDTSAAQQADPRAFCSVWALEIESDWDQWTLVGLFDYEGPKDSGGITTFRLPLERLGLDPRREYWAHEFWSGHFLGSIPAEFRLIKTPAVPEGYAHPGDTQTLIATRAPGVLDVSFFGPAVKLLVIRPKRDHPWIAATDFYQGGGTELRAVKWDSKARALSGEVARPAGHQGSIFVCGAGSMPILAEVAGHPTTARPGAGGSIILPVITAADTTPFLLRWQ